MAGKKIVAKATKPLMALSDDVDELRTLHPRVTDLQAAIVEHVIRTGDGPVATAAALGTGYPNVSRTLRLPHVLAYSKELAIASVGAAALQALATSTSLLNSRSDRVRADVAMDLMNRAGIGLNTTAQAPQLGVQINFNAPGEGRGPKDISPEPKGGKKASE